MSELALDETTVDLLCRLHGGAVTVLRDAAERCPATFDAGVAAPLLGAIVGALAGTTRDLAHAHLGSAVLVADAADDLRRAEAGVVRRLDDLAARAGGGGRP